MPSYFSQLPNVEYPKLSPLDAKISEYEQVKNIFKRGFIRNDIFQNLAFFSKYDIIGDERPDQVADKFYNDPTLDWVVLIANNIVNINEEWPMTQRTFDRYLIDKYGSYEEIGRTHHYESEEVRSESNRVIFPAGIIIPETFSISYYDADLDKPFFASNFATPITNYEYELRIESKKRNIYILKEKYLNIIYDDVETVMRYKKGSTQYVSGTLKKADNTKLTDL